MASLYKRANGPQRRMLAIVEGAVKNAGHYHSQIPVSDRFARSIAKRAVGTLSAQWPEVLAVPSPVLSHRDTATVRDRECPRCGQVTIRNGRGASKLFGRRSPLAALHRKIAAQLWKLKRDGETELVAAYIDVLKTIAKHEAQR